MEERKYADVERERERERIARSEINTKKKQQQKNPIISILKNVTFLFLFSSNHIISDTNK